MALLDRVATLVRANLNDLVDRAENPEKMLKQVILDMENQFMQVKTQVAIALADLHLLEKRKKENADKHAEWMRKAELAVDKKDDELARAALERAMSFQQLTESFDQQIADQEVQVEALKSALKKLELKLSEARGKADLLIAQHRRSRAVKPRRRCPSYPHRREPYLRTNAVQGRPRRSPGTSQRGGAGRRLDGRLDALEREQKIDSLLSEIKAQKTPERVADLVRGAACRRIQRPFCIVIPGRLASGLPVSPTCSPFVISKLA